MKRTNLLIRLGQRFGLLLKTLLVQVALLSKTLRTLSATMIGIGSVSHAHSVAMKQFARWLLPTNESDGVVDAFKVMTVRAQFDLVISERTEAFWSEYRQGREVALRHFWEEPDNPAVRQVLARRERAKFERFAKAWMDTRPSWLEVCDGPLSDNALRNWMRLQKALETASTFPRKD
ncbi:hypothetical protein [Cupriavidus sp. L7L]|uniref:hypothetical protein n=1 Tax=Cupriavidus sp. L7L TaxID=2546443 RepID=UPI0010E2B63B|nr:hypothetical protein [Cupriavidus sp. L7L]TDF62909.1 hypothetical protein E1J61_27030 [Cupriavidus sp. L7L]